MNHALSTPPNAAGLRITIITFIQGGAASKRCSSSRPSCAGAAATTTTVATMGECRFVMLMRMVISTMTVDDHIPPAGPPQRVPPSPHYPPHRISYHRPLRLGQVGVDGIGGRDVGGLGRGIGLYKGYTCIRPLAFGLKPGQLHLLPLGGVYFPTLPPSVPGGVALGGVAGWTGESHSPCACLSRPFSFRRAYFFQFRGDPRVFPCWVQALSLRASGFPRALAPGWRGVAGWGRVLGGVCGGAACAVLRVCRAGAACSPLGGALTVLFRSVYSRVSRVPRAAGRRCGAAAGGVGCVLPVCL